MAEQLMSLICDGVNSCISPSGLTEMLCMLMEGARNNTKTQILAALDNVYKKGQTKHKNVSSAIFVDRWYFDHWTSNNCIKSLDFYSGEAFKCINNWAEKATNGKIKNIFQNDDSFRDTKCVFINVVYFKGFWKQPFENTCTNIFHTLNDGDVDVSMMSCDGYFNVSDDGNVIKLPYCDKRTVMYVVLNGTDWRKPLSAKHVEVYLPKFKIEAKYSLNDALRKMGVVDLFELGKCDLTGFTNEEFNHLYASKIEQMTYINVDELGTEAAAVTSGICVDGCLPDPDVIFRADHPFRYYIVDENKEVMFAGQCVNPVA
ncbi:serpin [European chub iridovirus]|nr:serpin [European chub iridovirus]